MAFPVPILSKFLLLTFMYWPMMLISSFLLSAGTPPLGSSTGMTTFSNLPNRNLPFTLTLNVQPRCGQATFDVTRQFRRGMNDIARPKFLLTNMWVPNKGTLIKGQGSMCMPTSQAVSNITVLPSADSITLSLLQLSAVVSKAVVLIFEVHLII